MSSVHVQNPHTSYDGFVNSKVSHARSVRAADDYHKLLNGQQQVSYQVRLSRPADHDHTSGRFSPAKSSHIPGLRDCMQSHRVEANQFSRNGQNMHESLSSSGTQFSTELPLGDCNYGPVHIKGAGVEGLLKGGGSCGSDSLCKLVSRRPSSSAKTAGSGTKRPTCWASKNWVAKDARSYAMSPVSSPLNSKEIQLKRERADQSVQKKVCMQGIQGVQEVDSPGNVQMARRGMMDRAGMHQTQDACPTQMGNLVISPRNQPVRSSTSPRDAREHLEKVSSANRHPKRHAHHNASPQQHRFVTAGTAVKTKAHAASKAPNNRSQVLPEWTGLTESAMELYLKLREEEEVRQLRQRAVMRWLNHLPAPPKETLTKEGAPGKGESSCTSADESAEVESMRDHTATGKHHPKRHLPHYIRCSPEKSGAVVSPLNQAGRIRNGEQRSVGQDMQSKLDLVKKPEFEFVDEDSFLGGWCKKPSGNDPRSGRGDVKRFDDVDEEEEIGEAQVMEDVGLNERHICELDAIPEVVSGTGILEETAHASGSYRPTNLVIETEEALISDTDSACDTPIRPARSADGQWNMEMSSIEKWVQGKQKGIAPRRGFSQEDLGPDLEIAADAHEVRKCRHVSAQKRTLDDGISWSLLDDGDSSKIAAGFASGDGTKSPCSAIQTPKMSARSSMFSEDPSQRFHVKYTIPEGQAVEERWAGDEDCSEYLNSTTDLQSGEATPHCETVSEIPLPSPRPGTEYRPSGSIVDSLSADEDCEACEKCIPEVNKYVHEAGSPAPQATYWLPEFCQNGRLESRSPSDLNSVREPAHWHDNPLSPHYSDRDGRAGRNAARSAKKHRRAPQFVSNEMQYIDCSGKNQQPELTARQRLWRLAKQARNACKKSHGECDSSNKKFRGHPQRCTGLFSLVSQMCSSRGQFN